jgi:hypothetical protein
VKKLAEGEENRQLPQKKKVTAKNDTQSKGYKVT